MIGTVELSKAQIASLMTGAAVLSIKIEDLQLDVGTITIQDLKDLHELSSTIGAALMSVLVTNGVTLDELMKFQHQHLPQTDMG